MEPFGWMRSQNAPSLASGSTAPRSADSDRAVSTVKGAPSASAHPTTASHGAINSFDMGDAVPETDAASAPAAAAQRVSSARQHPGKSGGPPGTVVEGTQGRGKRGRPVKHGGKCSSGPDAEAKAPVQKRAVRAAVAPLSSLGGSASARRIPGRLQPWSCAACTFENPVSRELAFERLKQNHQCNHNRGVP